MRVHGPEDFERMREERLERLNQLLELAVATFAAGTALSVVALVVVWP
jgi:hypothetical protein